MNADLSNYLFLLILFLVFYAPIRLIFNFTKRRKYKVNPLREAGLFFLSVYTYLLSYTLICPILEVSLVYDDLRIIKQAENIFVPTDKILESVGMMGVEFFTGLGEIVKPILFFLPIGFLLALLFSVFERKLWATAIFGLLLGALIELPQIFTLRGFITDEIILYCVGAVLGALLLRLIDKFAHNKEKFRPIAK